MRRPSSLVIDSRPPRTAPAARPAAPADYLELYGLAKPPFGDRAQPAFLLFASHRRAFELLAAHVVSGHGLILLQGEPGIGKTETLKALAAVAADADTRAVLLTRPEGGRISLPQLIAALRGHPSPGGVTEPGAIVQFLAPPRRALLIDDFDLLPEDCQPLFAGLLQAMAEHPDPPPIVATASAIPAATPNRPDMVRIVAAARDTVRLQRLSAADARMYIERSLWIAGGTIRRLIEPEALKHIVLRSGGVPGAIDRIMQAALTAGFARGDAMINSRTVAAVTGPARPARTRYRAANPDESPLGARIAQWAALLLLGAGIAAFAYKAMHTTAPPAATEPAAPSPSAPSPSAPSPSAPSPSTATPSTTTAAPQLPPLPPALIATLKQRGEQALSYGDVSAARMFLQRAAEANDAPAAIALGKTYDPNAAPAGAIADRDRAAFWYRKAASLGSPEAPGLLDRLNRQP